MRLQQTDREAREGECHYDANQSLYLFVTRQVLHNICVVHRAAALIARDWVGDAMWALRDCETAIRLDATLPKAHYRRIQALKAMNQIQARLQNPNIPIGACLVHTRVTHTQTLSFTCA